MYGLGYKTKRALLVLVTALKDIRVLLLGFHLKVGNFVCLFVSGVYEKIAID